MTARHALLPAALCVAAALVIAGCATTVTGSPQPGTTLPVSPSTTSRSAAPTPPTSSAAVTSSAPATNSAVRPMPPLNTTGGSTATAPTTGATGTGSIGGVDVAAILTALDKAHVAAVSSSLDVGKVSAMVDAARTNGLQLFVVSIGSSISDEDTTALADKVFATTGGTLLVLSPSLISARSDQLTDDQRGSAVKAAADGKDDEECVSKFIAAAFAGAGVSTAASTPTPTGTHAAVQGVDIDALVAAFGPDHIAIEQGVSGVTADELSGPVQQAWGKGLKLYVGVLAKDVSGHLYDVADAVMGVSGGTVILLSPTVYAISSDTIANSTLSASIDAASSAKSDHDVLAAMVGVLLK